MHSGIKMVGTIAGRQNVLNTKNPNADYLFRYATDYSLMSYYLGANRVYLLTEPENINNTQDVWMLAKLKINNLRYLTDSDLEKLTTEESQNLILFDNNKQLISCYSFKDRYLNPDKLKLH